MWLVVSSGSDPIITELVGAGANVNAKTDKDATPLYARMLAFHQFGGR